ncbi:hypothetical protein TanjilG_13094 [Lupinus angustifolius]|uniref:Uncharacterized protein n=1 Tax=Lupinus angustifolius TaxID=3871 RepID=A0A1J7H6X8_LUPAN|nr:hypothetical protein TanjilG_13094 [Lupinus angustifolius]
MGYTEHKSGGGVDGDGDVEDELENGDEGTGDGDVEDELENGDEGTHDGDVEDEPENGDGDVEDEPENDDVEDEPKNGDDGTCGSGSGGGCGCGGDDEEKGHEESLHEWCQALGKTHTKRNSLGVGIILEPLPLLYAYVLGNVILMLYLDYKERLFIGILSLI